MKTSKMIADLKAEVKRLKAEVDEYRRMEAKRAKRRSYKPGPEAAFAAAQAKDHTLNTF